MGLKIVTITDIDRLSIQLNVFRPYDPKMIYEWSIGLIGLKNKPAILILANQLEQALVDKHKIGEDAHSNLFYLLLELRDRADESSWRMRWEN